MTLPARETVNPRASQLRPMNLPRPVQVKAEGGLPGVVGETRSGRSLQQVLSIRDTWRIDDEWWRQPISRRYFQVVLENGRCETLFRDLIGEQWFRQGY